MKKFIIAMILPVFMLVSCLSTSAEMDSDLKTLRIVSFNSETNQLFYVPIRAIIQGPGQSGKIMAINLGNQKLIQGILTLQEDPHELEQLSERARQKYGPEIKVTKDLTTDIEVKVICQQKPVWEHSILSGSRGLPFQVSVPSNASAALDITMHFTPSGTATHVNTEITKETRVTTRISSSTGSSATELKTRSFSKSATDNSLGKKFVVRQVIEF